MPPAVAIRAALRRLASLASLDRRISEATHASSVAAARLEILLREQRLLARQLTLPPPEIWREGPKPPTASADDRCATAYSTLCRQASFEAGWFSVWRERLRLDRRYHRKLWEYAFICQALEERGAIRAGARGLGFGVGNEPLTAYFASQNCRIVATDLPPDAPDAAPWAATGQYASGKAALRAPAICPDDVFDRNVEFRLCDMNAVSPELTGFDFCWSACALEHLGSLSAGAAFIERSMECLQSGGVAVHTTEYNLSSDKETLTSGPTVLFRKPDLDALACQLSRRGYVVAPFDLEEGTGVLDRYVDFPPYLDAPHLRLAIEGYASTSLGIIVTRPGQ